MFITKKKINDNTYIFMSFVFVLISFSFIFIIILKQILLPKIDYLNIFAVKSILNESNICNTLKDNIINFPIYEKPKTISNDDNDLTFKKNQDVNNEQETTINIEDKTSEDEEKKIDKFNIVEHHYAKNGIKCDSFCVKNITGTDINFNDYMNKKLDLKPKAANLPTVLIVHTHTTESYLPKEFKSLDSTFYPRSQDQTQTVVAVGEEINKSLKKHGIIAIHDKTFHDFPNYNGAYLRSAATVKKNLKKYESIKIVLDIHRDSIGDKINGKIKPVVYNKDKSKASQIMIITGKNFKNWGANLTLALKLQKKCENMFLGLTRPLLFSKTNYNQNLSSGSILIEVGSDVNTIDESRKSGEMLGSALGTLIKSN